MLHFWLYILYKFNPLTGSINESINMVLCIHKKSHVYIRTPVLLNFMGPVQDGSWSAIGHNLALKENRIMQSSTPRQSYLPNPCRSSLYVAQMSQVGQPLTPHVIQPRKCLNKYKSTESNSRTQRMTDEMKKKNQRKTLANVKREKKVKKSKISNVTLQEAASRRRLQEVIAWTPWFTVCTEAAATRQSTPYALSRTHRC